MKKTIILSMAAAVGILSVSFNVHESKGISGLTGSPDEDNCTSCHSDYPLNSGGGSVLITAAALAADNWKYTPGKTYTINITVANSGAKHFGFGFEALNNNNEDAGKLIITDPLTTHTQTAFNGRTNVMHKNGAGISANTYTYTFDWVAPAANIGTISFYVAGNAADNDRTVAGDYIYTVKKEITPLNVSIAETPVEANIRLFPNPVTDRFYVANSTKPADKINVAVFDTAGRLVLQKDNARCNTAIDVSHLLKGKYIVKIKTETETSTRQFVKN